MKALPPVFSPVMKAGHSTVILAFGNHSVPLAASEITVLQNQMGPQTRSREARCRAGGAPPSPLPAVLTSASQAGQAPSLKESPRWTNGAQLGAS